MDFSFLDFSCDIFLCEFMYIVYCQILLGYLLKVKKLGNYTIFNNTTKTNNLLIVFLYILTRFVSNVFNCCIEANHCFQFFKTTANTIEYYFLNELLAKMLLK